MMRIKLGIFCCMIVLVLSLAGCQKAEEQKETVETTVIAETAGENIEIVDRFLFLEEHVGKSPEEVAAIIGDGWKETDKVGVYKDSSDIQYGFNNSRLINMKLTYTDIEKGFSDCIKVYDYLKSSLGEERLDNVLPTEKTFQDIKTIEELKTTTPMDDGAYICSSNWFLTNEDSEWELPDSSNEFAVKIWEANQKKPMVVLDVRLYENEIWVNIGFTAVPQR